MQRIFNLKLFSIFGLIWLLLASLRTTHEIVPSNPIKPSCKIDSIFNQSEISIDCDLDLLGKSFTLNENAIVTYNGGSIKNGIIVMQGGRIDNELLNHSLTLFGTGQLNNTTYTFDPKQWDIKEGVVTDLEALQNTKNLNKAIHQSHLLGCEIFKIYDLDAFFQVKSRSKNGSYNTTPKRVHSQAIQIPSNFKFEMSANTFLRVQANNTPKYALLSLYDVDKSTISGGHLIGDRETHTYQKGIQKDTHEWGFLVHVVGSHHITIDNVHLKNGTGDGVYTTAMRNRTKSGKLLQGNRTVEHLIVKNCVIENNRRNNISLVDGNGILIEHNEIKDAGVDGVLPKSSIDLEAYQERNANGMLLEFQKIHNVTIRHNTFTGAENADIILFSTHDVEIYGNSFSKSIANTEAHHVRIFDNKFTAISPTKSKAIHIRNRVEPNTKVEANHHYTIFNNTITGYEHGITLGGNNQECYGNKIINCRIGIILNNLESAVFNKNIVSSEVENSYGIQIAYNGAQLKDVSISGDSYKSTAWGAYINKMKGSGSGLVFESCFFSAANDIAIKNSQQVTLKNCSYRQLTDKDNELLQILDN